MNQKSLPVVLKLCVLASVLMALVLLPSSSSEANASTLCVTPSGSGCDSTCGGCYATLQSALNAAAVGDEIHIAGGVYTAPGGTVADIKQSVVIRGGYDPTCSEHLPNSYITVLDGQHQASVVKIDTPNIVWMAFLTIRNGDGTGNCGDHGCGGGIYITNSQAYLTNLVIRENIASNPNPAQLEAETLVAGMGGGLYARDSYLEIWDSQIFSNTAGSATTNYYGDGGGIFLQYGTSEIRNNLIYDNIGSIPYSGSGGIQLHSVDGALIFQNTIRDNISSQAAYYSGGGGLDIRFSNAVVVEQNLIQNNLAGEYVGLGGGIYVSHSQADLLRNRIIGNSAGPLNGYGDGVCIISDIPITLYNNLIANNRDGYIGEGVYIERNGTPPSQAVLYNNTIVGNGHAGVYAAHNSELTLTNNLVSGHVQGIFQSDPGSSAVNSNYNLFWNDSDTITGSNPVLADPLLAPNYRPYPNSPALDSGIEINGVDAEDIVGIARPQSSAWDIGAFEGANDWLVFLPSIKKYGATGLLLAADFDDGTLNGWNPNLGNWNNPGDFMRGENNLGNAWNIHNASASNFVYEGTLTLEHGNAAGLVFRSNATSSASYDLILDHVDGLFKLSKRSPYQVLAHYPMVVEYNRPYQVRLVVQGDWMQAYLDNQLLLEVGDGSYTAGQFGVMLFQATASYDNLRAWESAP